MVTAETSEDVSYQRCVIFPKGTKIIGHVVRVTSGGHGRAGSAIFIQFDKATIKDGQEVILNAGIQALAVGAVAPMPSAEAPKSEVRGAAGGAGRGRKLRFSGIERCRGRVHTLSGAAQHFAASSDGVVRRRRESLPRMACFLRRAKERLGDRI